MNVNSVLLLKAPKDEAFDPYVTELNEANFSAHCVPVLSFRFINLDILQNLLRSSDDFTAVVLSSPRSAEAIDHAFNSVSAKQEWLSNVLPGWKQKRVYVVGEATKVAAEAIGLNPVGADSGNATNLAKIIIEELSKGDSNVSTKQVLFPCGQLALETLPSSLSQNGIHVQSLTVYETVCDENFQQNLGSFIADKGVPEYIAFFSPSVVNFSYQTLLTCNCLQDNVKLVAIGPTTEAAMNSTLGRVSITAARPTPQCLRDAIKQLRDKSDSERSTAVPYS